jgi:hypothetical protein
MSTARQLGGVDLPAHAHQGQSSQTPIRLKLMGDGLDGLLSAGLSRAEADAFLARARRWSTTMASGSTRTRVSPCSSPAVGHVSTRCPSAPRTSRGGPRLPVRPLLAGWAEDSFGMLTIIAQGAAVPCLPLLPPRGGGREDLPRGLGEELGEPDYENPAQASPVARPHTGLGRHQLRAGLRGQSGGAAKGPAHRVQVQSRRGRGSAYGHPSARACSGPRDRRAPEVQQAPPPARWRHQGPTASPWTTRSCTTPRTRSCDRISTPTAKSHARTCPAAVGCCGVRAMGDRTHCETTARTCDFQGWMAGNLQR